jgi:hypothetical protein
MISFKLEDDVLAIQDTVRKFAETELRAKMREAEEAGTIPESLVKSYRELGLSTLELPEDAGGLALGMTTRVVVEEELAFGDAAMAAAIDREGSRVRCWARQRRAEEAAPDEAFRGRRAPGRAVRASPTSTRRSARTGTRSGSPAASAWCPTRARSTGP